MFHTVVASSPMRAGRFSSFPMPPSMSRNLALCPPPMHHHAPHHQHSHHPFQPTHYQMVHPPNMYQHYHQQTSLHRLPIPPPPYHTIGHHSHPIPTPPPPMQPPPLPVPVPSYPEAIVEAPPGFTPMQVLCAVCCLRSHDKQETTFIHPVTKVGSGESDVIRTPPQHSSYRLEEPLARPTTLSTALEPRKMNKKKSLSGNSLRSPAAKRSVQSPVAMKGWLYKQGSDGLMLWKKRWFVLSDFCLFYYKGPEEDKILGSILLPSYKISPCTTDDRIYRKFAFKVTSAAEHHNMRTYYFASETKKEMQQWMNAMSLASILQNNGSFGNQEEILERTGIDLTSVGSVTGNEDEDSGFTSYHSRRPPNSPHQDGNSTLTDSYTSNDIYRSGLRADDSMHDSASESSYPEGYLGSADKYPNPNYGGGHQMHAQAHSNVFQQAGTPSQHGSKQHLYANAPPKPKRMGGPNDVYMLNRESEVMSPRQHSSQGQYLDYMERGKSGHHPQLAALRATREQPLMAKHRPEEYQGPVSSQRRTPDPYARTAVVQGFEYAAPVGGRHERNGHYTDDYAATIAAVAGQMHSQGHEEYQRRQPIEYQPLRVPKGTAGALRPQSAEFLVHEVYAEKGHHDMMPTHQRRVRSGEVVQNRPRSSIERYALPDYITNEGELADYRTQLLNERLQAAGKENQHLQELVNERRSGVRTPREVPSSKVNAAAHNMSFDSYLTRDTSYGSLHSVGAPQQSQSELRPHHMPSSHLEKLSATPSASMLALDAAARSSGSMVISPLARAEGSRTLPRDRSFMRSASARLPTATSMNSVAQNRFSNGGREDTRWKAQQREESMKRLLEWKQRMLQSPLTKKYPSKGGAAGLLLQPHSVPSSAATTPSSGMARLLLNDQQHRPTTPHRSTTPSQQQQQQQTSTQVDSAPMNSIRMQANEQYRQQVLKELINQETGLMNQPVVPLRAEETPERSDRNSLHWRDKDPTKGRESHDSTIIGKIEKGMKTSRTPSRSPNRTQEHRRSTSSLNRYYNSYSSDDEEVSLHELRRARLEAQASRARKNSTDRQYGTGRRTGTPPNEGNKGKMPDYVNINMLNESRDSERSKKSTSSERSGTKSRSDASTGHEYANLPLQPRVGEVESITSDHIVAENDQNEYSSTSKTSRDPLTPRRRHCSEPNRSHRCNRYYDDEYDDDGGDEDTDNIHSANIASKKSKDLENTDISNSNSKSSRKYFQDESTQTYNLYKTVPLDSPGCNVSHYETKKDLPYSDTNFAPHLCISQDYSVYKAIASDSQSEIGFIATTSNDDHDFHEDKHSVEEVRSQDRFFHKYYRERKTSMKSSSSKTREKHSSTPPIVRWQTVPSRSYGKSEGNSPSGDIWNVKSFDTLPLPDLPGNATDKMGSSVNDTLPADILSSPVEPPEPFRSVYAVGNSVETMTNTWRPCSPPLNMESRFVSRFSTPFAVTEEHKGDRWQHTTASNDSRPLHSDENTVHISGPPDISCSSLASADTSKSCRNLDDLIAQRLNPGQSHYEDFVFSQSFDNSDKTSCPTNEALTTSDKQQLQSFNAISDLSQPLDFRKQKESPPKNIVQERIKIFESQSDVPSASTPNPSPSGRKSTTSTISSKSSSPNDHLGSSPGDKSIKDSREMPELQKMDAAIDAAQHHKQLCSFRRRFHSDTETMMYDSSSDSSGEEMVNDCTKNKPANATNDKASNDVLSGLRLLADSGKGFPIDRKLQMNAKPDPGVGETNPKIVGQEISKRIGENLFGVMNKSHSFKPLVSNHSISMKDLSVQSRDESTLFGRKSSSDVEEYYLPMNGVGMGFATSGGKLPVSSVFGKLPDGHLSGNSSSHSWLLEDGNKHLLEADEAVYVQMDGRSVPPTSSLPTNFNASSIISPIEESGSDKQEADIDHAYSWRFKAGTVDCRSSTSSASLPDGGNSEHRSSFTFENYGYYEIAEDSQPTKDIYRDDSLSSHYEPIYAELKHSAINDSGSAITPLLGRFSESILNQRETSPSLPQRNSSSSSIQSVSKIACNARVRFNDSQPNDVDHSGLENKQPKQNINSEVNSNTWNKKKDHGHPGTSSASDADDEASKDIEINPRFSLSDSFRPASYYLKVSAAASIVKNSNNQMQASSDEELDSPPPIPLSPPPTLCDSEKLEHLDLHCAKRNNSDSGISSTITSTTMPTLGDDHLYKNSHLYGQKSGLPIVSKACFKLHSDSTDLSDFSPPTSPLHSRLNYSYYRVYEDERRVTDLLVKPMLAESVPPSKSAPSSPTSSTTKPPSLSSSTMAVAQAKLNLNVRKLRIYDEEKAVLRYSPLKIPQLTSIHCAEMQENLLIRERRSGDEGQFPSVVKDAETQWSPPVSSASESDPATGAEENPGASSGMPLANGDSAEPCAEIMQEESRESGSRDRFEDCANDHGAAAQLNRSPGSAPYYYSDLLREEEDLFGSCDGFSSAASVTSERSHSRASGGLLTQGLSKRRQYQLNNSRSIGGGQRFEVGRKVNNIELAQNRGLRSTRQLSSSTPAVTVEGDRLRVANELTNSIVYLEAKKLAGTEHNTYESDTLKKLARGEHDGASSAHGLPGVDLRNLYPCGIAGEKLAPAASLLAVNLALPPQMQSRRLSRSLEGLLLDEPLSSGQQESGRLERSEIHDQRYRASASQADFSVLGHNIRYNPQQDSSGPSTTRGAYLGIPLQQSSDMTSLHRDSMASSMRTARSLMGLDQAYNEENPMGSYSQVPRHQTDSRQPHFLGKGPSSEAFLIDREKLRQWDLMSSAPSAPSSTAQGSNSNGESCRVETQSSSHQVVPESTSLASVSFPQTDVDTDDFWVRQSRTEEDLGLPSTDHKQRCFLGESQWEFATSVNRRDDTSLPYHVHHHHFLVKRERSDFDGGGKATYPDCKIEQSPSTGTSVDLENKDVNFTISQDGERSRFESGDDQRCKPFSENGNLNLSLQSMEQQPFVGVCVAPDVLNESESWSGSLRNQKENRSPLRQQALRLPQKKKHRNDMSTVPTGLKTVREDINVSDSELQAELKMQNVKIQKFLNEKDYDDPKVKLSISAGDLLGKTHEELVLLLIQLRRDQAKLEHEMHNYSVELDTEHKMLLFDASNRGEHVNRQKQLIKQYEELTKQYDLTKPLINLVDNMVKLGSLYGGSEQMLATQYQLDKLPPEDYTPPKKMIEFSRRLQEQRLLQHEREEWDQIAPEQVDLQSKLQELCKLDQTLHEESYFVSGLQQDKDMLEKAVESLKVKLDSCRESPIELEKLQKQLRTAEKELTKIRSQLTRGTKKLEETASDNAKIENEILVLRQKMQASIKQGLSSGSLNEASHVKVQLEKELSRISNVMEDLAWKREELSGALEQLKDRNKALLADVRASPTGVAGSAALPGRKNHRSTYLETDLDTMETRDIIESWKRGEGLTPNSGGQRRSQVPLYVNTYNNNGLETGSLTTSSINSSKEDVNSSLEYVQSEQTDGDAYKPQDISDADDKMKRFYGILPREKPAEIKTVRIVKRESERRNKGRDRRKPSYEGDPSLAKVGEDGSDPVYFEDPELTEEMLQFQRSMSLPRNYGRSPYLLPGQHVSPNTEGLNIDISSLQGSQPGTNTLVLSNANNKSVSYYYRTPSLSNLSSEPNLSAHERLFGNSSNGNPTNPEATSPTLFTPTFKSEAARKIVAETAHELATSISTDFSLSTDGVSYSPEKYEAGSLKRRQKRRHYTISSSQPMVLETVSQKMVHARSRDDLDIERCLRSSNTPDVVKSTIKKNEMFDESTIDRELGLPQKILIPERYVEEEGEELSAAEQLHRLQKAESIRKMLSESSTFGDMPQEEAKSATLKKKFEADRKQREHLLALNQIIAKEVMERSKAVAAKAMKNRSKPAAPKTEVVEEDEEEEDSESPERPLPIIQQRENLLT